VREVIVDIPLHARDLLIDGVSNLDLPDGTRPRRLLGQDRQRRLQAVSEIAGLGNRTLDRLLAMAEQGVQIVDERLHFRRVHTFHPARATGTNAREARVKVVYSRLAAAGEQQRPRQAEGRA
jgi:hypothetical protein